MEQVELFCRWQALLQTVNNEKEIILCWVPVDLIGTMTGGCVTIQYGSYRCMVDSAMLRQAM